MTECHDPRHDMPCPDAPNCSACEVAFKMAALLDAVTPYCPVHVQDEIRALIGREVD